jgi:hypothetical protein
MSDGLITCKDCGEPKPVADMFYVNKTRPMGQCRDCRRVARRAWYLTHTDAAKGYSAKWKAANRSRWRDAMRKSRHGIAYGTYDTMLAAQHGGCATCGAPPPVDKALHVDHDHDTGRIRSLLCDRCNRGLGFFLDQPVLLERAAHYLRWHDRPRREVMPND